MLFRVDPAQNTCCPCGMVNIVPVEAGIAGIIVETGIKIRFFQCKAFTGAAFQFLQPAEFLQEGSGQYLRSEEHTSELQSLMRISYAVFCLKKKNSNMIQQ